MTDETGDPGEDLERFREYLALLARLQLDPRLRAKVDLSGVVQQSLLEGHRAGAQFERLDDGEKTAWLRRALRHNLIDEVRKLTAGTRKANLEQPLDAVLATLLELYESGQTPDRSDWLANYPQFATELQELFDSRDQVEPWAAPLRAVVKPPPEPAPPALDDYEILREIGRGGMGV